MEPISIVTPDAAPELVHGPPGVISLGVIVVNYASHTLVAANLAGLEQAAPSVRVVLVDNFSSPAEQEAARRLAEARSWHFVAVPENAGFGGGVNRGIAAARALGCVCFLLLNPDACIGLRVLEGLHRAVLDNPLALISPRIVTSAGESLFRGSEFELTSGRIRGMRVDNGADGQVLLGSRLAGPSRAWLPGTCVAVHQELLDAAGGLDESYFLYWEDVEFSYRCEQAGAELILRQDLVAVHDEGGTQGARSGSAKSELYYFYNCRNRLLFAAQHLPPRELWRWIAATPAVSWEILMRGGRRQLLHPVRPLTAVLRGSIAGVALALPRAFGRKARPTSPQTASSAPLQAGRENRQPGRLVTVAVLTYRRPTELARVLSALLAQVAEVDQRQHELEILVVDNDADGGGRSVVETRTDARVRYVLEPEAGIAAARNRALDETSSRDVLVFIDDDEVPGPRWLTRLLATYRESGADGVAGRVVSEFDGEPDAWITDGGFLARHHRDHVATGDRIDSAATNNLLLDLRSVRAAGLRFDLAFGLSGGEDSLFTRTLVSRGGLLVWCRDAVVTDHVPLERINRRWVLRRAVCYGNNESRVAVALATGPAGRGTARGISLGRALARIVGGCVSRGEGSTDIVATRNCCRCSGDRARRRHARRSPGPCRAAVPT